MFKGIETYYGTKILGNGKVVTIGDDVYHKAYQFNKLLTSISSLKRDKMNDYPIKYVGFDMFEDAYRFIYETISYLSLSFNNMSFRVYLENKLSALTNIVCTDSKYEINMVLFEKNDIVMFRGIIDNQKELFNPETYTVSNLESHIFIPSSNIFRSIDMIKNNKRSGYIDDKIMNILKRGLENVIYYYIPADSLKLQMPEYNHMEEKFFNNIKWVKDYTSDECILNNIKKNYDFYVPLM